jgi:hypothetical protein
MRFSFYIFLFFGLFGACLAITTESDPTMESSDSDSKDPTGGGKAPRKEETLRCVVAPKKGSDKATIGNIEDDLKKITHTDKIYSFNDDGELKWWIVQLTPEQLKEIKGHKGVGLARETWRMEPARAVHRSFEIPHRLLSNDSKLGRLPLLRNRDGTQGYEAQLNAVKELRQISIPKDVSDLDQWPDYVYEKAAGEGIYIYHIEMVGAVSTKCILNLINIAYRASAIGIKLMRYHSLKIQLSWLDTHLSP